IAGTVLRVLRRVIEATRLTKITPLRLALHSIASSPRRAAGGTTLTAALMLVLLMTTTHASFKETLSVDTQRMLTADVWVSQNGMFLAGEGAPAMREEIGAAIGEVPCVDVGRAGGVRAQRSIK